MNTFLISCTLENSCRKECWEEWRSFRSCRRWHKLRQECKRSRPNNVYTAPSYHISPCVTNVNYMSIIGKASYIRFVKTSDHILYLFLNSKDDQLRKTEWQGSEPTATDQFLKFIGRKDRMFCNYLFLLKESGEYAK